MDKSEQTIKIFDFEIPRYVKCDWCGEEYACAFTGFAYSQPCDKCKNTEKYEKMLEDKKKNPLKDHIGEAFKNQQVAGVWNYKGRNIFTNHKGDIIRDEPARPLKSGDPNWK